MANEPDELSLDDALEESRAYGQNPDSAMLGQRLPGDGDRPAAPPVNPRTPLLPDDHPLKDSNIDPGEAYDIGEDAVAEMPDNTEGKESL